jgi:hypothetical protein
MSYLVFVRRLAPQIGTERGAGEVAITVAVNCDCDGGRHLARPGDKVADHRGRQTQALSGLGPATDAGDVCGKQALLCVHGASLPDVDSQCNPM